MDTETTQKRKTLGAIPTEKFVKLPEWKTFQAASATFSDAKSKLTASKNKFREILKKHSAALGEIENLEFVVSLDKSEIVVYEMFKTAKAKGRREELNFD